MESLLDWLLGLDTLILVILAVGGFVAWELRSGEFPLRWFGLIRRDRRPMIYWIAMMFHFAILIFLAYIWGTGIRMPISVFFE